MILHFVKQPYRLVPFRPALDQNELPMDTWGEFINGEWTGILGMILNGSLTTGHAWFFLIFPNKISEKLKIVLFLFLCLRKFTLLGKITFYSDEFQIFWQSHSQLFLSQLFLIPKL